MDYADVHEELLVLDFIFFCEGLSYLNIIFPILFSLSKHNESVKAR